MSIIPSSISLLHWCWRMNVSIHYRQRALQLLTLDFWYILLRLFCVLLVKRNISRSKNAIGCTKVLDPYINQLITDESFSLSYGVNVLIRAEVWHLKTFCETNCLLAAWSMNTTVLLLVSSVYVVENVFGIVKSKLVV